jgi:hypothetical protein
MAEALDVELPVDTEELHQVEAIARLQAESSRNMYSEHGFEALMRSVFFDVCQRLMVVSNCMPGSPHCQVASEIWLEQSFGLVALEGWPVKTDARVHQSESFTTACMNSSVARTELLAF